MDIVAQVADGLQAAHSAGAIHRDIKPANILFTPDGMVRITDFGIAPAVGSAPLTATGMVMGTPGYLAPERVAGAQAGPARDLYALGIVAFECLAGQRPFAGPPLEVAIAHRDRPLPLLPASLPGEVAAFVMMLTAKDPAWRPRTAGEVAYRARRLRDRLLSGATDDHRRSPMPPESHARGAGAGSAPDGPVVREPWVPLMLRSPRLSAWRCSPSPGWRLPHIPRGRPSGRRRRRRPRPSRRQRHPRWRPTPLASSVPLPRTPYRRRRGGQAHIRPIPHRAARPAPPQQPQRPG
jgi:serine/threonine protein kinase